MYALNGNTVFNFSKFLFPQWKKQGIKFIEGNK